MYNTCTIQWCIIVDFSDFTHHCMDISMRGLRNLKLRLVLNLNNEQISYIFVRKKLIRKDTTCASCAAIKKKQYLICQISKSVPTVIAMKSLQENAAEPFPRQREERPNFSLTSATCPFASPFSSQRQQDERQNRCMIWHLKLGIFIRRVNSHQSNIILGNFS